MSFSGGILILIFACCWVALIAARVGILRGKRGAPDPNGLRTLRGALENRDIPDVTDVRRVRDVRKVNGPRGLRGLNSLRGLPRFGASKPGKRPRP
jgi:hypothetical protein